MQKLTNSEDEITVKKMDIVILGAQISMIRTKSEDIQSDIAKSMKMINVMKMMKKKRR